MDNPFLVLAGKLDAIERRVLSLQIQKKYDAPGNKDLVDISFMAASLKVSHKKAFQILSNYPFEILMKREDLDAIILDISKNTISNGQ